MEKCISSILEQSYRDFELILVDDGSKDQSGNICDEWQKKDERIVVAHQANQRVSVARNEGLKRACGKFITFADADEEVLHVGRNIDMGPWSKLYKRSIIDENNIQFRKDIKFAEDRIFIFEYLQNCKVVSVIDNIIYFYNMKNQNSAVKKYYVSFYE